MERARDPGPKRHAPLALPADGERVSGYLHRLVSSAMRPAMRVHPPVSPLFSTAQSALADEQAPDDESLSQGKAAVRLDSSSLIQARARFTPATQWHTR